MISRTLMELWQRRGTTFSERSSLLHRADAIRGIMDETLVYLQNVKGPVLDVGCGDGLPTISLIQQHQVIGVDFASTMLRRMKSNLPLADLLMGSIDHLPVRGASMSAVTCYFVLSDYSDPTNIVNELSRVLQVNGRIVLSDYSSNDDFNNLLDDLQVKILGKSRDMFRLNQDAIGILLRRSGLNVKTVKELSYPLTIPLDTFINQLYLSSVGPQYKEKELSGDQWRKLLGVWIKRLEVHVTRRFVLALGEKD